MNASHYVSPWRGHRVAWVWAAAVMVVTGPTAIGADEVSA